MEELLNYRQKLLDRLQELPEAYQQTLAPLSPQQIHQALPGHAVTIHQVTAHVRDAAQHTYLLIITTLLETHQVEPVSLPGVENAASQDASGEPIQQICASLHQLQSPVLDALLNSPPSAWSASLRHPSWGVRTLQWWVEQYLAHSLGHLHQIRHHLGMANPPPAAS